MDDACEKLFESLRGETLDLHLRWKLYRHLYAGPKEDIVLLNKSAPTIFAILQSLLFYDCVLRICRITDPPSRGTYEYLSVHQLAESLGNVDAVSLGCDLQPMLRDLEVACSKMRTLRNRQIAHADLNQALRITAEPLPGISIEDVNVALRLLSKLLNSVEVPLRRSRTFYGDVLLPNDDDAERLLSLLRQGNVTGRKHR
jgi:hypothetical protein